MVAVVMVWNEMMNVTSTEEVGRLTTLRLAE